MSTNKACDAVPHRIGVHALREARGACHYTDTNSDIWTDKNFIPGESAWVNQFPICRVRVLRELPRVLPTQ